jgi:uncharacterized membrane protein
VAVREPIFARRQVSLAPGILLGIGFGGFLDGIVMHQLLQWHHMVSAEGCCPASTVGGLEDNTLADGAFHAVAWLVAMAGSLVAVRAWRDGRLAPPWLAHTGALLLGWGIFNLLDSLNHFVFGLHHIRDDLGGPLGWDLGFLAFALVLIATGWTAIHVALRRRPAPRGRLAP